MRPNFIDVRMGFYGVSDFQPQTPWPTPVHISQWIKDHYTYSRCDSPFGQYQLAITMIGGPKLNDRMHFEILQVDFGRTAESISVLSKGFQTGTNLVSRFDVAMEDLLGNSKAWRLYQTTLNMAVGLKMVGNTRAANPLFQDTEKMKMQFADAMETALQAEDIRSAIPRYPAISPMLIDLFMEYKDTVYDLNQKPEPHLHLVRGN